ncbi:hypothetical protein BSR28_01495 [Boudabousia liubingyangii]|uniref:CAF17-like 4Fe-4S cluster assembly/insertion protein YgfZ n=1 Tax=Boudabousia liubingyangii TaxID=1921764 RepID=UPI00093E31FD|nr:hypothetical protein [Boudabousia liubingyangii]OKL48403.1 hypothetical protein BSR28_01495 [Boudabousia liubingyangii]
MTNRYEAFSSLPACVTQLGDQPNSEPEEAAAVDAPAEEATAAGSAPGLSAEDLTAQASLRADLPLHYGDPLGEQRRLATGTAVTVLPYGVVKVAGDEAANWLNQLCSQKVDDLPVLAEGADMTASVEGADADAFASWTHLTFLDAQGHIENLALTARTAEAFWFLTETPAALTEFLTRMRFRTQVEITDQTENYLVLGDLIDQNEAAALSPLAGLPCTLTARHPWPAVQPGGTTYTTPAQEAKHPGQDFQVRLTLLPVQAAHALTTLGTGYPGSAPAGQLNLTEGADTQITWTHLAGFLAWEALRIYRWEPAQAEIDNKTMPHELDLLRTAVHLKKGCYCGQETVARIVNVGRPPRRIVALHLDGSGSELPQPGEALTVDGKAVGRVTSVAEHYEDGPIALAVIKRNTEAVTLQAGPVAANVTEIAQREGKSAASPEMRPGAELLKSLRRPGTPRL